ncbi:Endonuclease/exonuclease/phosphatase superfamily, partial [Sesbania bispinosa]
MDLWNELRSFSQTCKDVPWCVVGDINTVLYENEKVGGGPACISAMNSFRNCIDDCHLTDIGFKGPQFTWSRGNLKDRLDRIVANDLWRTEFRESSLIKSPLPNSDHASLWLKMPQNHLRKRGCFKFLTPWLEHPDFVNQVHNLWRSNDSWE